MPKHRRACPTPRGGGKRDPSGGLPGPPTSLRPPCGAPGTAAAPAPNRRAWKAVPWVPYVGFYPLEPDLEERDHEKASQAQSTEDQASFTAFW